MRQTLSDQVHALPEARVLLKEGGGWHDGGEGHPLGVVPPEGRPAMQSSLLPGYCQLLACGRVWAFGVDHVFLRTKIPSHVFVMRRKSLHKQVSAPANIQVVWGGPCIPAGKIMSSGFAMKRSLMFDIKVFWGGPQRPEQNDRHLMLYKVQFLRVILKCQKQANPMAACVFM